MVSTGWFVICAPCFVTAFIFIISAAGWYEDNNNCVVAKKCVYVFFLAMVLGTMCVVMGFRAPDKMPVKVVEAVPSVEMIEQAVKKYIDNMTIDQKYDIIAKRSIH